MSFDQENSAYQRASVSLFRTAGWLQGIFDNRLRPHDLSAQQVRALSIIESLPPGTATVNDVREGMMDPNSNVSRLLNKLMEKGYIAKIRSTEDQRVVYLSITPEGIAARQSALQAIAGAGDVWSRLSHDEARTLTTLLDRLRG